MESSTTMESGSMTRHYYESSTLLIRPEPVGGSATEIRQNMQKTLWSNQQAISLHFDEASLRYLGNIPLDSLRFHSLTSLMITVRSFSREEREAFCSLSQLKLPVLQNLRIDSSILRGERECAELYAVIFDFVALHAPLLRYLTIRHSFRPFSASQRRPKLVFPFTTEKLQNMREDLAMLRLDELTIFLDDYEGQVENFNLGLQVLGHQTLLYRLEVQVGRGESREHYERIRQAVERNRKTLRHLTIAKSPMNSSVDDIESILGSLGNVDNLDALRLFTFKFNNTLSCPVLPSVKMLDLAGVMTPAMLSEIAIKFPMLEELQFSHLKADFGSPCEGWTQPLKSLLAGLKRLRIVRWYCPHMSLDFLKDEPNLIVKTSPTNAFAALIIVVNDKNV